VSPTRGPKCSREGCKARATKAGKCLKHYQQDYRRGERVREQESLGEASGRITFRLSREAKERFFRAVPEAERGRVLRSVLATHLDWLESNEETTTP
jgi:hypothetical protein